MVTGQDSGRVGWLQGRIAAGQDNFRTPGSRFEYTVYLRRLYAVDS